ncbi:TPM domain-containing protein [Algoriphagus namhaensis]
MAEKLFSEEDRAKIIAAIQQAELKTSGEIQVHIENRCKGDLMDRAAEVFETLKMYQTAERNGVLFYLAVADHKFAILGDGGINRVVPKNFWEQIKDQMQLKFKEGKFTEGLSLGIKMAGEQLQSHFPYDSDTDINELPDEISFGD